MSSASSARNFTEPAPSFAEMSRFKMRMFVLAVFARELLSAVRSEQRKPFNNRTDHTSLEDLTASIEHNQDVPQIIDGCFT